MILYGASGHAKVIYDICLNNNVTVNKILDDDVAKHSFLGMDVHHNYNSDFFKNDELIISIGNNSTRKLLANKIQANYGTIVHPNAVIDQSVIIKPGTVIMASAVINASSFIGEHCIINTSCSVDHDCLIKEFSHISPGAVLCGGVKIGIGTHIGAGAIVLPNVKIGNWCTIGAGTVVLKDVDDGQTIVGNPGRLIK